VAQSDTFPLVWAGEKQGRSFLKLVQRHIVFGWSALVVLVGFGSAGILPAHAQGLVPQSFFNAPIDPAAPTGVEANELVFDSVRNIITARGDVVVRISGYTIVGDELVYRRANGEMDVVGNVRVTDPAGNVSHSSTLSLTGGLKRTVLDAMTITANDGSRIRADSAEFDQELRSILTNAQYAPCGECVDAKGRRIGWSISAAKVVQNSEDGAISFEQPVLSLLGVPVAWLPYLWLPDLSNSALENLPMPNFGYSEQIGVKAEVPVSVYSSRMTDIILTPTLLSRQGFLLGAEWVQRFDQGSFRIKASGLYQLDPSAFPAGDRQNEWRGAVQADGSFSPAAGWTAGFAYAAFSDSHYFADYQLETRRAATNEVYATHLSSDTYVDARLQQFNQLRNDDASREQQGLALPNLRVERTFKLAPGAGQVEVEARMLGIYRARDYSKSVAAAGGLPPIPYDHGYAGTRLHGMAQASWQNQWIAGGAVVTPFAGLRVDAAGYERDPTLPAVAVSDATLFGLTPIAALDVRYPLVARSPGLTHLVEPIAQIVYRGASSSQPGITNEDSQSVVFDDSNLFSYNRFTGIDRQEAGLRLNVGGRYLASFDDGNYLELVAGQSFQLAGTNVFGETNRQQAGVGSGLQNASSYAVLGAYGVIADSIKAGGKVQIDSASLDVARAGLGLAYSRDGWGGALNYRYAAATPAAGNLNALHEVGAEVTVPIDDYWSASANYYWDIAGDSWLQAGGGLNYNDGYLNMAANLTRTGPTHRNRDDLRASVTFRLMAPAGFDAGYSGAVPLKSWLGSE
jgi:LPS-assembly protein